MNFLLKLVQKRQNAPFLIQKRIHIHLKILLCRIKQVPVLVFS